MIKDIDVSKTFSFRAFVTVDDSLLSEDIENYLDSYNLTCFLKLGTVEDSGNSLFCAETVGRYYFQIRLFNSDSKEVYLDKIIYFDVIDSLNCRYGLGLRGSGDKRSLTVLEVFMEMRWSETGFPYTSFCYKNNIVDGSDCSHVTVWFKENLDCSLFFRHLRCFLRSLDFFEGS